MKAKSIPGADGKASNEAGKGAPRIALASTAEAREQAKTLFREYADGLGIDLSFQDFEGEMARWPGAYAPPDGALLLAWSEGRPAGCVGLRRFVAGITELKRLYVRPAWRGHGLGAALALAALAEARRMGYGRVRLDTLPSMSAAQALYAHLGFREIAPYGHHPVPGTRFMELALSAGASAKEKI